MNFFRLLLLAAVVYLITRLLRSRLRPPSPPSGSGEKPSVPYEPMARCARCGVHMPQTSLSPAGLCQHCQP
jgi:hypothetical protein